MPVVWARFAWEADRAGSASRRGCPLLTELRLNHNQLAALPADLSANRRLRILDLGGNPIASWEGVQVRQLQGCPTRKPPRASCVHTSWCRPSLAALGPSTLHSTRYPRRRPHVLRPAQVLAELPQLRSLSLKGTPLATLPDYRERIAALLPRLEILDNQRIRERPRKRQLAEAEADDPPAGEPAVGKQERTAKPAAAAPRPAAAASKVAQRGQGGPEPPARPAEVVPGKDEKQAHADKQGRRSQQTAAPAAQGQQQEKRQRRRKGQQGGSGPDAASDGVSSLQQPAKHGEADPALGNQDGAAQDRPGEGEAPKKKRRRRSKRADGGAADGDDEEGPTLGQAAERAEGQVQPKPAAQLGAPGAWQEQPFGSSKPAPDGYGDSDDDAADAAELLGRPAKKKLDPKQTGEARGPLERWLHAGLHSMPSHSCCLLRAAGVLKVIDATRRKSKGKQQGGVSGAQALQALLHPASMGAGFGDGLPGWD